MKSGMLLSWATGWSVSLRLTNVLARALTRPQSAAPRLTLMVCGAVCKGQLPLGMRNELRRAQRRQKIVSGGWRTWVLICRKSLPCQGQKSTRYQFTSRESSSALPGQADPAQFLGPQ